jgi:hypothetical protein
MSEHKRMERHIVIVSQSLDATGTFNITISAPWTPDELKVKELAFSTMGGGTVSGVWRVNCDSLTTNVGQNNLGTLVDPCRAFTGVIYPVGRPVSGTHTFRILTAAGIPAVDLTNSQLIMHLEFRRYV